MDNDTPQAEQVEETTPVSVEPPTEPIPVFHIEGDTQIFKDIIECVKAIVDEVRVSVALDGISIKAVCPAHVSMVSVAVPAGRFSTYSVSVPGDLGIDIEKIENILKIKAGDKMAWTMTDGIASGPCMEIQTGKISRNIQCIDIDGMCKPKFPDLSNLPAHAEIDTDDWGDALKTCALVSDFTALSINDQGVQFMADNDVKESARLAIEKIHTRYHQVSEPARSLFSLDYLQSMEKAARKIKAVSVRLNIGTDFPLKAEIHTANLSATFLMAPRIED